MPSVATFVGSYYSDEQYPAERGVRLAVEITCLNPETAATTLSFLRDKLELYHGEDMVLLSLEVTKIDEHKVALILQATFSVYDHFRTIPVIDAMLEKMLRELSVILRREWSRKRLSIGPVEGEIRRCRTAAL